MKKIKGKIFKGESYTFNEKDVGQILYIKASTQEEINAWYKKVGKMKFPKRVRRLMLLIQKFYEIKGNGAGGKLHIVLDDGNLSKDSIRSCIKDGLDKMGLKIANLLLELPIRERRLVYNYYYYKKKPGSNCL